MGRNVFIGGNTLIWNRQYNRDVYIYTMDKEVKFFPIYELHAWVLGIRWFVSLVAVRAAP
jgi:hypothetical protein